LAYLNVTQAFKILFQLLSHSEQRNVFLLLLMVVLMAFIDILGIASIMPFIAVLSNPEIIETNQALTAVYGFSKKILGVSSQEGFIFFLGLVVLLVLVLSLIFKALTSYMQTKFALMREYTIGKRLVEEYLCQPYEWFLNRNSSDLGKNILSEVGAVVHGFLVPMMNMFAQSIVTIFVLILLLIVDYELALTVGMGLAIFYFALFKMTSRFLLRIGKERLEANEARFLAVSEAFSAIKEVKLGGLEYLYRQRFSQPAVAFAEHQASAQVIGQLPRFALEGIAFGGLLMVVLYLINKGEGLERVLPVITLYAFAAYRLMPALQQIYNAITQLRFYLPALNALHNELNNLALGEDIKDPKFISKVKEGDGCSAIELKKFIRLNSVYFSYPGSSSKALKGVDLVVNAKNKVGIVGGTGSGKTTSLDLILGLLKAQHGSLEVDGQIINEYNRREWQKLIGYVPQQIYLSDDTIAANIAFGVDKNNINYLKVESAAKIANLHDFIVSDLSDKYQTIVGERGVRLSGGQRQRIAIARALYKDPQVLILDEATSALDNITEKIVMETLQNLDRDITIIIVAHRLSTVKECDIIFLLEKGELIGQGSFDDLVQSNQQFKAMLMK